MKDNLGNELKKGDRVAFIKKNRNLEPTKIQGFSAERVRIKRKIYSHQARGEVTKVVAVDAHNLIKLFKNLTN